MEETTLQTIERVNVRLAELLGDAQRTLSGERDFEAVDVRRLREPVTEMAPIVAQATELRRLQPEIAGPLEVYKSHLRDLQTTLIRIRIVLQTRATSLQAGQTHNTAVSRWASAFHMTR